jgi:hypothetical protein
MNTARSLDAYAPTDRFTLTPRGAEYLATRGRYDPSGDYDDRDEAFTGAEYTNDLAPADDADVIPFP